ncbi:MAG TPA: M48 family metalloprotease [Planctomycetota bacterium]|nr:M48 family metalloprotease [Planctomycetota bacterium]
MTPLLPVALGAIVAGIVAHVAACEPLAAGWTLGWSVAFAILSLLVSTTAARVGTSRVLRSDSSRDEWAFLALVLGKWPVLLGGYALLLSEGGLVPLARQTGRFLEGAVALTPWVVACFAAWLGHDVGESAAIVAAGATPPRPFREIRGKPRTVLFPLAVFLALATGLECLSGLPGVAAAFDSHPRGRSFLGAVAVLVLFALGPILWRILFPTRKIAPPLEGERLPSFRLWDLGSDVAAAMVAGLLPGARTIFVTPRLLSVLDPEEGLTVIRHELGHARLGHLTATGLAVSAFMVVLDELSPFLDRNLSEAAAASVWLAVLGAAALAYVFLARRFEHDADLYAARGGREPLVASALIKVCEANGEPPGRGGIRHPSVERRIALLERAQREPGLAERRLGRTRGLLLAVGVLALLVLGQAAVRAVLEVR